MKRPNWKLAVQLLREERDDLQHTIELQAAMLRERKAFALEYRLLPDGCFVHELDLQGELL